MAKTKLEIGGYFFDEDNYGVVISDKEAILICPTSGNGCYRVKTAPIPTTCQTENLTLSAPISLAFRCIREILKYKLETSKD